MMATDLLGKNWRRFNNTIQQQEWDPLDPLDP